MQLLFNQKVGSESELKPALLKAKWFEFVPLFAHPIENRVLVCHQLVKLNTAHLQFPMQAISCKNLGIKEMKNVEYHTPLRHHRRAVLFLWIQKSQAFTWLSSYQLI